MVMVCMVDFKFKSQRVKETKSQRDKESKSQRVKETGEMEKPTPTPP